MEQKSKNQPASHSLEMSRTERVFWIHIAVIAEILIRPSVEWLHGIITAMVFATYSLSFGSLGAIWIISTFVNALISYGWVFGYDKLKKDMYFMERMKRHHGGGEKSFSEKLPYVVALSIFPGDPVLATIYGRDGIGHYNGFKPRDHGVMLSSLAISNAFYTAVWALIIQSLGTFAPAILSTPAGAALASAVGVVAIFGTGVIISRIWKSLVDTTVKPEY